MWEWPPWHEIHTTFYESILTEEDKLQISKNKVHRKIFKPKRDGIHGQLKILHDGEFQ
jgi:hypothetical protein